MVLLPVPADVVSLFERVCCAPPVTPPAKYPDYLPTKQKRDLRSSTGKTVSRPTCIAIRALTCFDIPPCPGIHSNTVPLPWALGAVHGDSRGIWRHIYWVLSSQFRFLSERLIHFGNSSFMLKYYHGNQIYFSRIITVIHLHLMLFTQFHILCWAGPIHCARDLLLHRIRQHTWALTSASYPFSGFQYNDVLPASWGLEAAAIPAYPAPIMIQSVRKTFLLFTFKPYQCLFLSEIKRINEPTNLIVKCCNWFIHSIILLGIIQIDHVQMIYLVNCKCRLHTIKMYKNPSK